MAFVAAEVKKRLVYAVVFDMLNALAQQAYNALAHGCIELHVGGKELNVVTTHNVLNLENGVATMKPTRLGFGCERHYAAVVAGEHTDRLAFKPRVKTFSTEQKNELQSTSEYIFY